jgi:hypothetical protein
MFGRRATVAATTLALTALGGGIALASTHGSRQSQTQHAPRASKSTSSLVKVHLCRPGRKGSRRDALQ